MARRLKELSLSYDRILFVAGMSHIQPILQLIEMPRFPTLQHAQRTMIELCTLNQDSCREVMAECGWISNHYELARQGEISFPPDRQKLIFSLYKTAARINTLKTQEMPFQDITCAM